MTTIPAPAGIVDFYIDRPIDMVILRRTSIPISDMVRVTYGFVHEDDAVYFKLKFG
jgi:hypothetical protein